jgi:diguanylate cyclase (GGDEF)-like protein
MADISADGSSGNPPRAGAADVVAPRSGFAGRGHQSVRARLMGIVAVGAILAVIVGLAGLNGVARVSSARGADLAITDVQLALARVDGDRKALDAAVLEGVLAGESRSKTSASDAQQEFAAGAVALRLDFASAAGQGLSGPLQAELWKQWPQLAEYVAGGQSLMSLAANGASLTGQLASYDELSATSAAGAAGFDRLLSAASEVAEHRASAATTAARLEIFAIGGVALLLLLTLAWRLGRSIIRALREVGATAAAITAGDLDARTTVTGDDEIGHLGIALNDMAESLRRLFARLGDEARRDAFRSQLAEAFEIADTVPDACAQVERAMAAISDELPMELLLADSSQANLDVKAAHPVLGGPGCPVHTPYSCVAVRRGSAAVFDSSEALNACPQLRGRPGGACSAACIPVTFMGRALGVLHTTGPDGNPPSPQEVVRLTALAAQAGTTIGTVRSTETNVRQAKTDGLTGLVNRRTLENEMRAMIESGRSFAVAMADVDHFKIVNDTYGHEAGDRALRLFAQIMQAHVRADDIVGRYGGEEFVLVFAGQTAALVVETLERLRAELASAQTGGATPRFTASYGLADSTVGATVDEILRVADAALATAKREGRDRVIVAPELRAVEAIASI